LQLGVVETTAAWVLSVLLYPGLLFGLLMALGGEWLLGVVRSIFTSRIYRQRVRFWIFTQPANTLLKLAGRGSPASWRLLTASPGTRPVRGALVAAGVIAPVLALSLMPMPGNPLVAEAGTLETLLLLLGLLAVQPLVAAFVRMRSGSMESVAGTQSVGRFITGLLPALLIVAALAEVASVAGAVPVRIADLLAAPQTAPQTLVRIVAGVVLLLALPWWLDWQGQGGQDHDTAGTYLGRLLQTAALSAFWALLVLPVPGDFVWALAVMVGGALLAYIGVRLVGERWAPAARERDGARLLWATSVPVAGIALLAAFWGM
jgi:hypothetical protein